jgi:hypothetical protein
VLERAPATLVILDLARRRMPRSPPPGRRPPPQQGTIAGVAAGADARDRLVLASGLLR